MVKSLNLNKKAIIIVISIIALIVIPSTYAVFKSTSNHNGIIALAEWSVTLNSTDNDHLVIVPNPINTTASYTITITNTSEVDITYDIVISNLPSGVSVALDERTPILEDNNTVVISNAGTLSYVPNNNTKSHTLIFSAGSSTDYVTNKRVNIDVIAKQLVNN